MSEAEMKIDPVRAEALISQLREVKQRVAAAANGRKVSPLSLFLSPTSSQPPYNTGPPL